MFDLKHSSGKSKFKTNHIMQALKRLGRAKSPEITTLANELGISDIQEAWQRDPRYDLSREERNKQINDDLKWGQVTERGARDILNRLVKEGIATKEYYVYQLTKAGKEIPILAEQCGITLLESLLSSIPKDEKYDHKFVALIDRLGIFMGYVLTRNLLYDRKQRLKKIERDRYDWLTPVINTEYLMDWFTDKFLYNNNHNQNKTQQHKSDLSVYKDLMESLNKLSHKHYDTLIRSEMEFNHKVLGPLKQKHYDKLEKRLGSSRNN